MTHVQHFTEHGYVDFGPIISPDVCSTLKRKILATRDFGPRLFMAREDFERLQPDAFNKNPRPGANLLDDLSLDAKPVLETPLLKAFLVDLLGPNYQILRRKLVCGVPRSWLPEWIHEKIEGRPSNNLAHFVRPEYTDITYFYGIDYHQDLVDWRDREPDFVTIYVYIDDVTDSKSPLFLLPRTFEAGAATFPHQLRRIDSETGRWEYTTPTGGRLYRDEIMLTRPQGSVFGWHPLTLHGTQPTTAREPRVSMRFLIARDPNAETCELDRANQRIRGPRRMTTTRVDLDAKGHAKIEKNALYEAKHGPLPRAQ
ncbi:MAG: phytanoyl-CoA dioxygenase family protein [Myxococcales bacterium FL481]|nr:MAG: phytanoyl-CoA dioxygenase family protein [Myxococcales bacterium FL481]